MNPIFHQQAQALLRTATRADKGLQKAVELILHRPGKVVVTGIGKSGIVAHKIAATLASTGTPSVFLNAGEALHGDLGMVGKDDVVIMLSKSANTAELAHMLPSIRRIGAAVIGIFGNTQTLMAKSCDVVLDASVDEEACPLQLAPTTSTTVSMVMGDALAIALMTRRGFTPDQFALFHPAGTLGRRLLYQVRDVMRKGEQLPRIAPGDSLRDGIREMSRASMGAVCVVDPAHHLLGILTEGDVRRLFLQGIDPLGPLGDVMTRTPKTIRDDARLGEALDRMEQGDRKVYVLPVLDEQDRLVGILRMHDIVSM
jgi:arabinose-5-phosphate isomerase